MTSSSSLSSQLNPIEGVRKFARILLTQAYLTYGDAVDGSQTDKVEEILARYFGSLVQDTDLQDYSIWDSLKVSKDQDCSKLNNLINRIDFLPPNNPVRMAYTNQIIRIAHHLSQQTYIGYYSLLFNYFARLDKTNVLNQCLINSLPHYTREDFFPELYQNSKLTSAEKAALISRQDREYESLKYAFEKAVESQDISVKFFRECWGIDSKDTYSKDTYSKDTYSKDTYSKCYNQICIGENYNQVPTFSTPPSEQLFLDNSKTDNSTMHTFCLSTRDLLITVTQGQINPLTQKRYSNGTLEMIRRNFETELKLVEYTVNKLNIPPQIAYTFNELIIESV